MSQFRTDDVRIEQGDELLAPMQLMRELPANETSERVTFEARRAIHDVLRGADDRLLVVNPMLTGRFHWAEPSERRRPMTALVLVDHALRHHAQCG